MCCSYTAKIVLMICVSCWEMVESMENLTLVPYVKTPRHRGAARQMYGSGSLRPRDSHPVYATDRRHYGERSTISPDLSRFRDLPYPGFPYPPEMYPIPEVIAGPRSSTRSGGYYGGRIEYYSGKPDPVFLGGKYPYDLSNLPGRGFIFRKNKTRIGSIRTNAHNNPFDDSTNEAAEDTCSGSKCAEDEYLCASSCICISQDARCDKRMDCKDNEDEFDCSEYELERHNKCTGAQNTRCISTGKCILKEWLCDGEDDCGDFSDETQCEGTKNCTAEEFECSNGLCIPKTWVCDNEVDCKDFSDEWNCTQAGCKPEEFDCGDDTCIPQNWKCDRQRDCVNGEDEDQCNLIAPVCLVDEFLCSNHKCIKAKFKCDGDNDCGDWSDEYNCNVIRQMCEVGEFRCSDGRCIPERYRCDKQRDCNNNDDEANCDYSIKKNCSFDEYSCQSGSCILKTWVCDGSQDCSENEDENDCKIVCDESKFPCAKSYPDDNSTSYCINKKHVCDGQDDCPKAEDEMNCPKMRECEKGTKCEQLCITNHNGSQGCSCRRGFNLAEDGVKCIDIDECQYATDPVCSQTCTNTVGSFKCGCLTGYVLRPDLRSCKAQGATPTLLFANRKDIRQASLSSAKYTTLLKGLHNAIFLNYHYEKQMIFWSDMSLDVIRRAYINGSSPEDVVKIGLEAPGGLAIDWIHDLIFWTDAGSQRIEVASLDGRNRAILAADDMDKPRAIAVHPGEAMVFWADWGPNPKIESAEMDGRNRKKIITESIFWPNGLALDYTTDRIYWADAKHNVIESSFLDGTNRRKVVSKGLPHPFAITIFEDIIYWTDWHTKSISSASKSSGKGLRTIHSKLNFPMDIHSFHPQRQPKYKSRCDKNNGCSHMCLPNKKSYSCVCRFGQKLGPDGKSCVEPEKFIFYARKKNLVIKHLDEDALHEHDIVLPVEGLKAVSGIAWDSVLNIIIWTDVEKKAIYKAFWNGSSQETIVETNLESPIGIGYDWLTKKIYWVDARMNRLEVVDIEGNNRCLLVWEDIDTPRDIVVNPYDGFMYWTTWGEKPRIEKTGMDGSARSVIISEDLISPSGLSIDFEAKKLYWADGIDKCISMSNFDGTKRKTVIEGSTMPHPYGLDVFGKSIYWTDWANSTLERANKLDGSNRTLLEKKVTNIMQVKIFHRNRRTIATPCDKDNGGCTHLCLLKPFGYSCACPTGIKLKEDGKSCASGPTNYLILAHGTDIRQISLDVPYTADVVLPFPPLKMAVSVDVDRRTGEIYWTDTQEAVIKKIKSDGSDLQIIIMHELMNPDGIAIDSTGRKIYWTDRGRSSIEVCELDGSNRKVLFSTHNGNPRAIALHYHHGLIFWSDWGSKPKIEVANMDGQNRKVIIDTNLEWPNGLAIDRPTNKLYWNDAKKNKIESCSFNGQNRKIILQSLPHPYGLVIVGNHMYWTDWKTQALHRAEKFKGSDSKIIRRNLTGLMDVRAVQTDNIAENACGTNNGGCSHLCLRNPTSYTCACPTGILLKKNSTKICENSPSTFILVSTRFAISRISLDTADAWDYTLPIKNLNEAYDLDFHWTHKKIYYNDLEKKTIRSINMNDLSDVKDVIKTATNGITVDWIADNIYWTNSEKKTIEVARLDGSYSKTVIGGNLQDPHSVAVFPRKGFLYWTDWKEPKIERSYLDGSSRLVLINEDISFPLGLTIDFGSKRLYWIEAKSNEDRIETANLHGQNRISLDIKQTLPYALAQLGSHIYWTDWKNKSVYRADKTSGKEQTILRPDLDAAMGITIVSETKQQGWNPCAINNGGCEYLCFYTNKNYTCGCPDDKPNCKKEPAERVPEKCPKEKFNCGNDYDNDDDSEPNYYDPYNGKFDDVVERFGSRHTQAYYIISFLLLACVLLMTIILVAVILFMRAKHRCGYGHGSSFANPNYYSPNNDSVATNSTNGNLDKRQFIWKRLKYDKSQERVYEETVGTNSPEVVSLIPMYLTPNSSKCDGITSSLERSPSATPLQEMTEIDPVI
ncbi:low-density lipoprotein receptor-related protein 4 [Coccinella septempunctata]|uniref:low-density lipoprotein receptor-related protein 4 n=1 Tax=Coccinella septempunctata TaxID=41139 RepID=UPI001D070508|nr:low-density lipoprotein receptor-related protein 4 [Coccinella septempunctata]